MKLNFKVMCIALVSLVVMTACESKDTPAGDGDAVAKAPVAENTEAPKEEAKEAEEKTGAAALKEAEEKTEEVTTAKVGSPAPEFTLKDQDGNEVKLSQFKGKPVVLEWTNPGCPYVQRHYKAKTMSETHKASGGDEKVVWLAIDSSNHVTAEKAAEWKKTEGFEYPVLLDASGETGKLYGATTTPHMYIVDKEGVLVYAGAIDDNPRGDKEAKDVTNYVSQALKALEEGKPVESAETKSYGCTVKYKS